MSSEPLPPISDFSGAACPDSLDEAERRPPDIPGYQISELLGRGGMGLVFRAIDEQLKRDVAIKFVHPAAGGTTRALERFQREAEAVARLQHPNIIQIFSYGSFQPEGKPRISYLVLEFASGGTLNDKIAGNPQSPAEAAFVTQLLARAVQYAHERGIIHRDLKPQNVLLTPSPKIADFGLARLTDDNQMLTAENARPGTPNNMSPEQVSGEFPIGPATDIYALGTILYELLTGRPPFKADSRSATLHLVQHERPVPPSRYAKKISRDLDAICLKCLAKAPTDRYESAEQLADDLKAYLELRPTIARRRNSLQKFALWTRRYPVPSVLGIIALTVAAFLASSLRRYSVDTAELKTQHQTVTKEKEQVNKEREIEIQKKAEAIAAADAAEKKRRHQSELTNYAALVQLAYDAFNNHEVAQAQALVQSASHEFRGWEWNYLKRICNDQLLSIDGRANSLFFTPTGRELVTISSQEASVWDSEKGKLLSTWKAPGSEENPSPRLPTTWQIRTRMNDRDQCGLVVGNSTQFQILDIKTWNILSSAEDMELLSWTGGGPDSPRSSWRDRKIKTSDYLLLVGAKTPNKYLFLGAPSRTSELPIDAKSLRGAAFDRNHLAVINQKGELELFRLGQTSARIKLPPQKPPIEKVILFGAEDRFLTLESGKMPGGFDPNLEGRPQSSTLPKSAAIPNRQEARAPLGPGRVRYQLTLRSTADGKPIAGPVTLQAQAEVSELLFNSQHIVISALSRTSEPIVEAFSTTDLAPLGPLNSQHSLAPWARLPWVENRPPIALDEAGLGLLAIGYQDGVIEIWNLNTGVLLRSVSVAWSQGGIRQLALSPSGDRLAVIVDDGQVKVLTLSRGQQATTAAIPKLRGGLVFGGELPGIPVTIQWRSAEAGRDISVVGQWGAMSNRVRLRLGNWEEYIGKPSGEVRRLLQAIDTLPLVGLNGQAWELPISSQILSFIVSPPNSPTPFAEAENDARITVATAPDVDNNFSLSFGGFTDRHLWPRPRDEWKSLKILSIDKTNAATQVSHIVIRPENYIAAFTVSNGAERLAIATNAEIRIYNALTGGEILRIPLNQKSPASKLAFAPADDLLAVGFDTGHIEVIGLMDSKTLLSEAAHQTPITLLSFSPKGTFLVSAGAPPLPDDPKAIAPPIKEIGAAKVWRPIEGKLEFEIPHARPLDEAISFNTTESRIAVVNHHQQLEIWETDIGMRLLAFRGHCCAPAAVSFNPEDDSMLVSAPKCHSFLYVWSAANPNDVPLEVVEVAH